MMKRLRLSPAATVTKNENGVLLQSDLGDFQLHGRDIEHFLSQVSPLLDGQYTVDQICTQLPQYGKESIRSLLNLLQDNGLVDEVNDDDNFAPPWQPHERFFKAWSAPEKRSTHELEGLRVLVIGLESWSITMIDELANAGIGAIHVVDHETLQDDDVLCNRFLQHENIGKPRAQALKDTLLERAPWCDITHENMRLDENDEFALSNTSTWDLVVVSLSKEAQYWLQKVSNFIQHKKYQALYGSLDGLDAWIGPVVVPEQTSCWNCLRLRKLGTSNNPQMAHHLEQATLQSQQSSRSRSLLRPMAALTGQQMAMEVLKLLMRYTPSDLLGKVRLTNLVSGKESLHTIIPMPWCEVCHHGESCSSHKKEAHTLTKTNPLNHIHSIEQLKKLLAGWIDPVTGIIRQLSGHQYHLPDFPVTASAGVAAFSAGEFDPRSMGHVGSGKGFDDISAHIGAVGEAIERYSAARFRKSDCKYASIKQLTGDFVDPESLVLYSSAQYKTMNFPFSKWRKNQKIHWTKGSWLGTEKDVWVPALVSYFNFSCPYEEQFTQVSSNGLAAGQNNEDAGIRATYELIERDAMMLTWYAQLPCQRLSMNSHYQGKMRVMIDDLTARGVQLELYLLDVGIHVPTVVCLALGNGINTPAVSVALATHGDINIAIRKALLEQGHVMPYLCHVMQSGKKFPQHASEVQSLEDHASFYFSSDKKSAFDFMRQPKETAISPDQWAFPLVKGVDDLRQRLLGAKVDVAIVDVTSPDVSLSPFRVARAVGVDMQPIHFGEQFNRFNNPRLRQLLKGRPVNKNPHPIA